MSTNSTTLYIGFARKDCGKTLVRKTFAGILGADYIEKIHEKIKKDPLGHHKTFKMTFKENTPGLQEIVDRITRERFVQVTYKLDWDWKSRKYMERYWKVFNNSKVAFKPRIMELKETSGMTEDEADTAKDFDDLAEAIARFGEEYAGSIAPQIPKPPLSDYVHVAEYVEKMNRWQQMTDFDPEEEIVLKCEQVYDPETEEWNELKAALEVFSDAYQTDLTSVREIPPISEWEKTPPKPPILRRATALQSEELLWGIAPDPRHTEQIWGEQVPTPPMYTRAENTLHNYY